MLIDGRTLDIGPARQRCVLAALAVDVGRVVSVDRLIQRVWGDKPPSRAKATLLNYLSRLRLLLAAANAGATVVARRPGGYALEVERSAVDLLRFHDLCAQSRADDDRRTMALLQQALALWRGEALTGIEGDWATAERDWLHQQLLDAECDLADVLLRLGHGEDLVATLSARTAQWPLDERVAGQFLLALHRAGRTADALAHYRQLRARLVEQLGTEPGTALRELHQRILDADPTLIPPTVTISGETAVKAEAPVPRQLPAPPRWFTGRGIELARLDEALTPEQDEGPRPSRAGSQTRTRTAAAVAISAIGGAGGIGKTWLALAWAHHHAEQFPDGQLFTDLRGFTPTGQPVAPDAALFGFLTALGVAPDRVPTDLDARAALYRSLVAGRRMLIVLDNAATADQVVPLLPGSPTCAVLVTGRTRLASLIDRHGARHVQLDVLTLHEACALLVARLGSERVTAEPGAVDEVVELCGRYPLALSIVARHAATSPGVPLATLAADLRELGLEVLDHNTDAAASLPAVLSWSLRRLTDEQRTVFGLLGIAPGPDIDLPATTSLTGLPSARARRALRALENSSLLVHRPGDRHAMHDLVRAYAITVARRDLPEPMQDAALSRVVNFYLHTALAADNLLDPHRDVVRIGPLPPGVHPCSLPDLPAALDWLDNHHPHLLAAQHAVGHRHELVWQLAWTLHTFHWRRGLRNDELAVWQVAARAVAHLTDPGVHIRTHRRLGHAYGQLERHEQAVEHMYRALALAERHDDSTQRAHTHHALGWEWARRGDHRRALEHAYHALDLYRALDQQAWEALALNQVGWHAAHLGEFDTARDHCRIALALHRRHHSPTGEATALDGLGVIEHRVGRHREALHYYRQAVSLRRGLGNTTEVAETLERLAHPHAALGHHDQACEAWREALELYRGQGREDAAERVLRQLDGLVLAAKPIGPSDAAGPRRTREAPQQ